MWRSQRIEPIFLCKRTLFMSARKGSCNMAARGPDFKTDGKNFHRVRATAGSKRRAAAGSPAAACTQQQMKQDYASLQPEITRIQFLHSKTVRIVIEHKKCSERVHFDVFLLADLGSTRGLLNRVYLRTLWVSRFRGACVRR